MHDGLETVAGSPPAEGRPWRMGFDSTRLTKESGEILLAPDNDPLFGPCPDGRGVGIMVTMPGEAAGDYGIVRDLVAAGAGIAPFVSMIRGAICRKPDADLAR
jgi:hypothetical protein